MNHIKAQQYGAAAKEVENSKWFKQTPKRVRSFAEALRRLDLAEARRGRIAEEARYKREAGSR